MSNVRTVRIRKGNRVVDVKLRRVSVEELERRQADEVVIPDDDATDEESADA